MPVTSLQERLLTTCSILLMPILFLSQISLGFYMLLSMKYFFMTSFILTGILTVLLQYSVYILIFSSHYKRLYNYFYPYMRVMEPERRKARQRRFQWIISLNPVFPWIQKYYSITIPIIEICFFLYLLMAQLYWSENEVSIQLLNTTDYIIAIVFLSASWGLFAFPYTSLFLGFIGFLITIIPVLIIRQFRFRNFNEYFTGHD